MQKVMVVDNKAFVMDGDEERWVTMNGRHVLIRNGEPQFSVSKPNSNLKAKSGKLESQKKKIKELRDKFGEKHEDWTNALENESERRGGSMDIYRKYVMAKSEEEKDKLWKDFE